ncbi:hypothetical protein M378DRAFT_769312 [Amanita muscaria Koide BX008]|uniref:Uncharacterized protein n=1 Tax=Amanita muscaria (strain Koide BX008) TaxID=946122 RepID=A0A0C2TPN4_AMAMK|nr:hypothetical protein M378DRAFT_769312 [Amanita muscaria Koide BX008]
MGQVPTEEKKTSILQKTPPPAELFSLNFASTPKQDLPMPVAAPQSTLPNSDAFLIPLTKGETVSKPKTPEFQCPPPTVSDEVAPKLKTPEPQILPPLSRIPFMPLQTLTDAELHMTVEEWIRYQMEVEFDKLKRDGEKEMARFKARAEEVRKMIESL